MIILYEILTEMKSIYEYYLKTIPDVIKKYKKVNIMNKIPFKYVDIYNDIRNGKIVKNKTISDFLKLKVNKNEKVSDYLIWNGKCFDIIKDNKIFDIKNVLVEKAYIIQQFKTAIEGPIVNWITIYEKFLRLLIELEKDSFINILKKESLTYEEIHNLGYNNEKINDYVVEKYCMEQLRGENKKLENVIKIFEIGNSGFDKIINEFNEIYYRRNIYVHSLSKLSKDYLSLPNEIINKWASNGKLDQTLKYVKHAYSIICNVIILIALRIYTIKIDDVEEAKCNIKDIEQIVFSNYYKTGYWSIAEFSYKCFKNLDEKFITSTDRYFYFINYMVCLKAQAKNEEFKTEIDKWNCQTNATIYKIAKKVLTDDFKRVNTLIKSIYIKNEDDVTEDMYEDRNFLLLEDLKEWPVLRWYRKTEEYKQLLKELGEE